jgi:hypothetical protein
MIPYCHDTKAPLGEKSREAHFQQPPRNRKIKNFFDDQGMQLIAATYIYYAKVCYATKMSSR